MRSAPLPAAVTRRLVLLVQRRELRGVIQAQPDVEADQAQRRGQQNGMRQPWLSMASVGSTACRTVTVTDPIRKPTTPTTP